MRPQERSPPGTWRLLIPAIIGWACASVLVIVPDLAPPAAMITATVGVSLVVFALRRRNGTVRGAPLNTSRFRRPSRLSSLLGPMLLLCAVLLLVASRVALLDQSRSDPTLALAAEQHRSLEFEARLAAYPQSKTSESGTRHWVRAQAEMPGGGVPVIVWLGEPPQMEWGPGTRVIVRGVPESRPPDDHEAYAVDAERVRSAAVPAGSIGAAVTRWAASVRVGLRSVAARIAGAELVPGFAVGDTSLVPEELDEAMLSSSLSHLTAVSGANCALVIGSALWLLGRLGMGRRWRLAAAGAALAGFVALVGPDSSVQRAALMAAVLLVSGFGGKRAAALPALGLAMLVLLVSDPWQSLQPGFALSVASTGGILLATEPVSRWLHRRARIPRVFALPVAVAFAAQSACGPLLLLLQPGIPAVGVLANVVAAPAAPIGTGLGLAAALAVPLGAGAADLLVGAAALPAQWVAGVAHLATALPAGRWHWPQGWPGAVTLTGCQLMLLLAWGLGRGYLALPGRGQGQGQGAHSVRRAMPRMPWHSATPAPRAVRVVVSLLIASSLGIFVGITLVWPAAELGETPRRWVIVACDIGQGDALLLRNPRSPREVMLVDTGDEPEKLTRCLDRFRVRRIALLVLSHDDRDHVGALESIIGRVDRAMIAPTVAGEATEEREVVRQLEEAGVPFRIGHAGDRGTGIDWRVIAPASGEPADANAASLVMIVDAGAARVLLLADTGFEEQSALLRAAEDEQRRIGGENPLRADVLKVAHHGSRDQDPRLPAAVGARWALVSVGADNRYGHPTAETIANVERSGARVLRTDESGSVALILDDADELVPWLEYGGRGVGSRR